MRLDIEHLIGNNIEKKYPDLKTLNCKEVWVLDRIAVIALIDSNGNFIDSPEYGKELLAFRRKEKLMRLNEI